MIDFSLFPVLVMTWFGLLLPLVSPFVSLAMGLGIAWFVVSALIGLYDRVRPQ